MKIFLLILAALLIGGILVWYFWTATSNNINQSLKTNQIDVLPTATPTPPPTGGLTPQPTPTPTPTTYQKG